MQGHVWLMRMDGGSDPAEHLVHVQPRDEYLKAFIVAGMTEPDLRLAACGADNVVRKSI